MALRLHLARSDLRASSLGATAALHQLIISHESHLLKASGKQ